jgi:hypothetical protein
MERKAEVVDARGVDMAPGIGQAGSHMSTW